MKKHVDLALNSPSALEFMKAFMNTVFRLKIILLDL